MQIALDPYMHRHLSLSELCKATKEMGYDHIELSPRADFLQWWTRPRVYPERLNAFKKALKDHFPAEPHFVPNYNPWEQRFCLAPDGDFYKAIIDKKGNKYPNRYKCH